MTLGSLGLIRSVCNSLQSRESLQGIDVSIASINSMCKACMLMQVKSTAHLLLLDWPPQVCLMVPAQGPNRLSPT